MRALPRRASELPRWGRGWQWAGGALTHPTAPCRRAAGGRKRLRPGGGESGTAPQGPADPPRTPSSLLWTQLPFDGPLQAGQQPPGFTRRRGAASPARRGVWSTAARTGIFAPRGQTHGRWGPAASHGCSPGRPAPPGRLNPPWRRDSGLQRVKRGVRGARRQLGPSAPGRRPPERRGLARGAHERRWQRLSPAR